MQSLLPIRLCVYAKAPQDARHRVPRRPQKHLLAMSTVGNLAPNKTRPHAKDQKKKEATYARFIQKITFLFPFFPSVTVVVVTLFLGWLGKLLLPSCVCLCGVDVWEDEVEDVGVPGDWLAFDALFDVL